MRPRTTVAMLATAALLVAGCAAADPDGEAVTQERIAGLEDEPGAVDDEPLDEDPAEHEPPPDEPPPDEPAEPARQRTPEGLIEQLRTLFPPDRGPDDAWEPGVTPWSEADPPASLEEVYETPGALAFALAAALEGQALGMDTWETTTRVLMDEDDPDLAYVAVLSWGYADDAVAGADWRMTITHDDEGWSPGGAEQRFHCRRGVTDDGLCV